MKKLAKLLTILVLCLSVVLGTVGCSCGGKKGEKGVLAIAAFMAGDEDTPFWLKDMVAAYKQDYPDAKIETRFDALVRDIGVTAYQTNDSQYDMIFLDGMPLGNAVEEYGSLYCLNDLYNNPAEVNGEKETMNLSEKIRPGLLKSVQYGGDKAQYKDNYYLAPAPSGPTSIIFNCDAMEMVFGEDWEDRIPNTTDELIKLCQDIKTANKKVNIAGTNQVVRPFVYSKALEYWRYLYLPFIAQYSGIEAWERMQSCKNDAGQYDKNLYFPDGKEKALEVLYSLINKNAGFADAGAAGYEFTDAQGYFLQGRACMYVTGSWLEDEMSGKSKYNPDLKMVRVPIVSALGADMGITDAQLSAIVDAIDAGETELAGVDATDFARVAEARKYVYTLANSSISFVPECALNKDLALQFYRYMYSDKGLQIMLNSGASLLPCEMNSNLTIPTTDKNGQPLSVFRQSVYEVAFNPMTEFMYSGGNDPINYRAGLAFTIQSQGPEAAFLQKNPKSVSQYMTAERGAFENKWPQMMVNVG